MTTPALVVLLAIAAGRGRTHQKAPPTFLTLLDRASRSEGPFTEFGPALTKKLGLVEATFARQEVWIVDRIHPAKDLRYVTVEGYESFFTPSASHARIAMFDRDGKTLGNALFQTGWRNALVGARRLPLWDVAPIVVELQVTPGMNGRYLAREFFGFDGTKPVLLRLEAPDGSAVPNFADPDHFLIGPPQPKRTADEWATRLASSDPNRVLDALMWATALVTDDSKDAQRTRFLERGDVRSCLERLKSSKLRWMREGAEMALNPPESQWSRIP